MQHRWYLWTIVNGKCKLVNWWEQSWAVYKYIVWREWGKLGNISLGSPAEIRTWYIKNTIKLQRTQVVCYCVTKSTTKSLVTELLAPRILAPVIGHDSEPLHAPSILCTAFSSALSECCSPVFSVFKWSLFKRFGFPHKNSVCIPCLLHSSHVSSPS